MSFFDSIRRFFSDEPAFDSDLIINAESSAEVDEDTSVTVADAAVDEHVDGLIDLPTRPVVEPAIKNAIFDGVVAVFNDALPDFLRRSVDPARQSALIAESLDKSLSEYLDRLGAEATLYAEAMLKQNADSARKEAEKLRHDMEALEQQRLALREQQLSAERRRRALADRVADLEAQLANAEAEREQFDLEKKSLLNKIKLADVQPAVIEELQKEIDTLRSGIAAQTDISELEAKLEQQAAEITAINQELAQRDTTIAEQKREIEAIGKDLAVAREHVEQLSQNTDNSTAMYNDLQHQLVDEREARLKAEAEAAEARKIFDSVMEMQQQMQQVEGLIQKRDERIARLKASNKKLKEELEQLRAAMPEQSPADMDAGLFDLDADPVEPTAEEEAAMASLDDDFECPDWFVSQPEPSDTPRVQEDTFGYTPPARKHTPENDAQLSLF